MNKSIAGSIGTLHARAFFIGLCFTHLGGCVYASQDLEVIQANAEYVSNHETLKLIEIYNNVKYSGKLSEVLKSNKNNSLDWFKNKTFELDSVFIITECTLFSICYAQEVNGPLTLRITQEKEDQIGRQLHKQLVRVVKIDPAGNIVLTRITVSKETTERLKPSNPMLLTYAERVSGMDGLIRERIRKSWTIPPSVRNSVSVVLQISMSPNGTVTSINVARSSGYDAFDDSALNAVRNVSPLLEMDELEPSDYQPYRSFKITLRATDQIL